MLKLHFTLVQIRTISICCDSFEAYKWLQMKLENKCKIPTHFFSRMEKSWPAWCMPSERILFLSRSWRTQHPITLYLNIPERLSVSISARHSRSTFDLTSILPALKDNEDNCWQLFIILNERNSSLLLWGTSFIVNLLISCSVS